MTDIDECGPTKGGRGFSVCYCGPNGLVCGQKYRRLKAASEQLESRLKALEAEREKIKKLADQCHEDPIKHSPYGMLIKISAILELPAGPAEGGK